MPVRTEAFKGTAEEGLGEVVSVAGCEGGGRVGGAEEVDVREEAGWGGSERLGMGVGEGAEGGKDGRLAVLNATDEEGVPVRVVLGALAVHDVAEVFVDLARGERVAVVENRFAGPEGGVAGSAPSGWQDNQAMSRT